MAARGLSPDVRDVLIKFLLSMADEKFFLGHRNSDWTGLGPFLEEDIAFSNIAQDEIAHAQELYRLAAPLINPHVDVVSESNRLAYGRPLHERLNATLVELPDEYNWAVAIIRQFFYDHFDVVRLARLGESKYQPLADLSGKMLQEVKFHIEHFDHWVSQLGRGTTDSMFKLQQAVNQLWPHSAGLFEGVPGQQRLVAAGIYPGHDDNMEGQWFQAVSQVLKGAGVQIPGDCSKVTPGGRSGRHTLELQNLLDELAEVYRLEPSAHW